MQNQLERTIECDKCHNNFIQKWVVPKKSWSKINEVEYWTNGRKWEDYKLVCRACLKDWFENKREKFSVLIDPLKKKTFVNYNGYGVFDKPDLVKS